MWSEKIIQVCWCKNAGIPEYWRAFKGVTKFGLVYAVDVEWMEARGIPHGLAVTVFEQHIKRLRQMAHKAGIFTWIQFWM
jgi:hypothetical protein